MFADFAAQRHDQTLASPHSDFVVPSLTQPVQTRASPSTDRCRLSHALHTVDPTMEAVQAGLGGLTAVEQALATMSVASRPAAADPTLKQQPRRSPLSPYERALLTESRELDSS